MKPVEPRDGDAPIRQVLRQRILALVAARHPERTICPSEVARSLEADERAWRALMPLIRDVAADLAAEGLLAVTRKGVPVDPREPGGPIRLGRTPSPQQMSVTKK